MAFVNYGAGRRNEAVEMWEQVREATARIPPVSYYEQGSQHERAAAFFEEILRVRADFTVQDAIELMPGMEGAIGAGEVARFTDALHEAGLP